MNRKRMFYILISILSILIIFGGVYYKMQYDEAKKAEQKYFDEQKERITLYMKYNVKNYESVTFTDINQNPMSGYAFYGYVNNDKDKAFTASTTSKTNFQFNASLITSEKFDLIEKKNIKTVSQIKEEQAQKKESLK